MQTKLMQSSSRATLKGLLLVLLLAGVILLLAFGIERIIREMVVIPLSYLSWLLRSLVESLPQDILWGVLVFFLLIFALRSLNWKIPLVKSRKQQTQKSPANYLNTKAISASVWLYRIQLVSQRMYSRTYFNRQLSYLFMEVESFSQYTSAREVKQKLLNGSLPLPPAIRQYLLQQEEINPADLQPVLVRLWHWLKQQAASLFHPQPRSSVHAIEEAEKQLIQYLEKELEINDAHHNE